MKTTKLLKLRDSKLKSKLINIYKTHKYMLPQIVSDYRKENQWTSDLEVEIVLAICRALRYFVIALLVFCFFSM